MINEGGLVWQIERLAAGVLATQRWVSNTSVVNSFWEQSAVTGAFLARCCQGCYDRGKSAIHGDAHLINVRTRCCVQYFGEVMRIGEARNPGPPADNRRTDGITVTTGNGTGWGTILEWLGSHQGDVLCAQEHKVIEPADIEYEKDRAFARGWKSFWTPAVPSGSSANCASGGAVVLVKRNIGAARPPGGDAVLPGRVAAAMIETSGFGWMVLYSVYGKCGDELGAANWAVCEAITCHAIRHGLPWCAAGDWNFEPHTLRASGWLAKMGAELMTAPIAATTHAGGRAGRHLDFFVASRGIFALGPRLSICTDAIIRTHDAVSMRLPLLPRSFMIRKLVRPRTFPREKPIGPAPQLETPIDLVSGARAALERGECGDNEAAKILIDDAAVAVNKHLEEALVDAYMITDDQRGYYLGRDKGIGFAMAQLTGPKTGKYGSSAPPARRLRMIQDRATALAAALARHQKRMLGGRTAGGSRRGICLDVQERARAAIKTGHYIAAMDANGDGHVATINVAYALELKSIGKWAEAWAIWEEGDDGFNGALDKCGRSLVDTTPSQSRGLCPSDQAQQHGVDVIADENYWADETARWCRELAIKANSAAEPAEAAYRNDKVAAVRRWAEEASQAGAAMAHRWTKVPEGWRPETVRAEVDGLPAITANPAAVVEAERSKWHKLWCPDEVPLETLEWPAAAPLARPTVSSFRRAANRIPRTTGIGVEGILPADFDILDDRGIEACIDVMMACEAVGYIPKAIALILVRMIPKRDGGRRPIGLLPSLYRIWAKLRAGEVRNWEREWAREYFTAGPGKSADAAAWKTALRAELATSAKASSASVLWDLLKCFEHGRHFLLVQEVDKVGFPVVIARMSAEMYRAERRLVIDDAISEAIRPTRGFMAGCARALALIKVLMIRRMDAYVARHPRVNLDIYVDDVEIQAVGTGRIVDTIAEAASDLRSVLTEELGFPLADEKARVIASNDDLVADIVRLTGGRAGKPADKAVKLGVELTSGRRIGRRGGHKRDRLRKAMARQRRIFRFKKMGGAANKVVRRGVIPATAYGTNVTGVSNAELRQIRTLVAQTKAPNTKGASVALKLLLDGDPAADANAAPLVKWAEVAWEAAAPVTCGGESKHIAAGVSLTQRLCADDAAGASVARRPVGSRDSGAFVDNKRRRITGAQLNGAIAHAAKDTEGGSWETVRGPASASYLTAGRINWQFRDGTTVVDERGRTLDMAVVAPCAVRSAVLRATAKATAIAAASRWNKPEFVDGIWVAPVRAALRRLRPAPRAALRRAWTGGYWSRARLADAGLVCDGHCDKCGAVRDDDYHRIWECTWEDVKAKRDAFVTPQMQIEAARVPRDDVLYTRGLRPSPWACTAAPRDDFEEVHVDGEMRRLDTPLVIDGPVFVDGSALWPNNSEARRAGWSVVMIGADGQMIGGIYGHLPWSVSDEQTAGSAEMYALRRAAEMSAVPLIAYTDYKDAADGALKGEAVTTSPKTKHAAHWRAFWRAVDGSDFAVRKVKGHVTEAEVAHDANLKWKREGNRYADRLAKMGARAHYSGDQWTAAKATISAQENHTDLCEWIGVALGEWPAENQVRRRKPDRQVMLQRRQARRDAARGVGGHRVAWGRDGWKCQDCGAQARTPSGATRLANQPCKGHITTRIPRQEGVGGAAHKLWTAEAENDQGQGGANVTWCAACGAYSSTKLYKLRGRCSGQAQGAALTRLRALQALRHPVLGYRLSKPHRMTDTLMEIMIRQAGERRQRYNDVFKMHPGDEREPRNEEAATRDTASPSIAGSAPMHCDEELGDAMDDYDVFGHGGDLDLEENAASRLVLDRPSASGDSLRAVPFGLADGGVGGTITKSSCLSPDAGDVTANTDITLPQEPSRRGASSGALSAMPVVPAARRRRGTKVWTWQYQFGDWRWVAASENCEGRPCICDLGVTLDEMREIVAQRGIGCADDARKAQEEIEDARHARRRDERRAMIRADTDAAVDTCQPEVRQSMGANKRQRRRPSTCDEAQVDTGVIEGAVVAPIAGHKRKRLAADDHGGAAKARRIADAGPSSTDGAAWPSGGASFESRADLIKSLRGATRQADGVHAGLEDVRAGKRDTTAARIGEEESEHLGEVIGGARGHHDGGYTKKQRRQSGASSSTTIPAVCQEDGASQYGGRRQLLEALRGSGRKNIDDRKGEG